MGKILFLRVFEKRKKFCYLTKKPLKGKNTVIRDLSSCIIQSYHGYQVVKIEKRDCQKQMYKPIDIVYDPAESPDQIVGCYFTSRIHVAYRFKYSKGPKGIETLHDFECYSYHKFHSTKKALKNLYQFACKLLEFFTNSTTKCS